MVASLARPKAPPIVAQAERRPGMYRHTIYVIGRIEVYTCRTDWIERGQFQRQALISLPTHMAIERMQGRACLH